jgi:N-acetylglutamate synthase-like GNAT family acetyltransferase
MNDWTQDITTRGGLDVHIRPAEADDEEALGAFFSGVTPEDMRFRFLTGLRTLSHDCLESMVNVDHRQTENFLAFSKGKPEIIATAMLACTADMEKGEVAIAILPAYKQKGLSWELLTHVARFAEAKGVTTLESVESRDHHAAIELEREMGFIATSYPGDATLMLVQRTLVPSKL